MPNVDFTKVFSPDMIAGDDEDETQQLKESFENAKQFIGRFRWCKGIKESYFGAGVGKIVSVFLFRIEPLVIGVDEWMWVIVGDIPPAYIVTDMSPNPSSALESYISEMRKWVTAVKSGEPADHLIPVNAPPTQEYAKMLGSRLDMLEKEFVSLFSDWEMP